MQTPSKKSSILAIVPNWNGAFLLPKCLESLKQQTKMLDILVIDNGSTDGSIRIAEEHGAMVLKNDNNLGFTGGVNPGITYAIKNEYQYVLLFNNDAEAQPQMAKELLKPLKKGDASISTAMILNADGSAVDSLGDGFSVWGLGYPIGRDKKAPSKKSSSTVPVFAASGGVSLYRTELFKEIGLFDDDFFAYFEDVDLSFRARLAGHEIVYCPDAVAHHATSTTSNKISGFGVRMGVKNMPWVVIKNTPKEHLGIILPRFALFYGVFVLKSLFSANILSVLGAFFKMIALLPKKISERKKIQKQLTKKRSQEIYALYLKESPPLQKRLKKLEQRFAFLQHSKKS